MASYESDYTMCTAVAWGSWAIPVTPTFLTLLKVCSVSEGTERAWPAQVMSHSWRTENDQLTLKSQGEVFCTYVDLMLMLKETPLTLLLFKIHFSKSFYLWRQEQKCLEKEDTEWHSWTVQSRGCWQPPLHIKLTLFTGLKSLFAFKEVQRRSCQI